MGGGDGVSKRRTPAPLGVDWSQSHHQGLQVYADEPLQGPRELVWTHHPGRAHAIVPSTARVSLRV